MREIDIKNHTLFESYINGELNTVEEDSFIKNIEKDESFATQFNQFKMDKLAIKEMAKEELRVKAKQLLNDKLNKSDKELGSNKWQLWISVIGIMILIAISTFICTSPSEKSTPQHLYASHFELLQPSCPRSADQDISFARAMNLYAESEFDQSLAILQNLNSDENGLIETNANRNNLFIGLNNMVLENHTEAIKAFQSIEKESSYMDDAIWYEGLATLKIGEIDKAKNIFQKLIDQNHYKSKEALEILKEL